MSPISISTHQDYDGYDIYYEEWQYQHLTVTFLVGGSVDHIMLTDRHYSTARNIRVGDTIELVRQRYGSPAYASPKMISYEAPENLGEMLGINFLFNHGKVEKILIGVCSEY